MNTLAVFQHSIYSHEIVSFVQKFKKPQNRMKCIIQNIQQKILDAKTKIARQFKRSFHHLVTVLQCLEMAFVHQNFSHHLNQEKN